MVGILGLSMFVNFYYSETTFHDVIYGFIPSIPHSSAFISILGSIIMP